jgi:hypothetical protein
LNNGQKTATDLVTIFLIDVWRFHSLPSNIELDWDSRIISTFWKALIEALDIQLKRISPFHPQTDGHTQRVKHIIAFYLQNYFNYEQSNWFKMLPMAEYVNNNSLSTATRMSFFFVNIVFDPQTNWPYQSGIKVSVTQTLY